MNCAGISPRGTVESTDEALWDRTLAVNLKGAWLGIKAALPCLRQAAGPIINIGSTRATRPMPGLFSYVVSKAGLWGLTQQVAVEYLDRGGELQHDRARLGRHAQRALDPGPVRPSGFPRGDPQPDHARGDRRGRRLPGVPRRRARSTASSSTWTPASTSPTMPGWSTCPIAAGRPLNNASKNPDRLGPVRSPDRPTTAGWSDDHERIHLLPQHQHDPADAAPGPRSRSRARPATRRSSPGTTRSRPISSRAAVLPS